VVFILLKVIKWIDASSQFPENLLKKGCCVTCCGKWLWWQVLTDGSRKRKTYSGAYCQE